MESEMVLTTSKAIPVYRHAIYGAELWRLAEFMRSHKIDKLTPEIIQAYIEVFDKNYNWPLSR
jgi:hypothetical protein